MSTHVGDIFFDAKIDRSQYDKGLKSLDKTAGKLGASIGRKLSAGFAVAGFTKFIKDATKAGASLNAMGTIIDASLPHMTKQVDEFAKRAGAQFGLSETQAKGFVGKFASMASAMGYTEDQAYKMSTALTGLAGDVASYYHISQDDAYAKLGAVFTGETESLKQLGVVMTQNALDAFALERGYGKVTAQMSELEKTTLRYQFVMDRLNLASGDFAKYANTWSGSIATIKLNWSNFMAVMGQGIINVLLPLLQMIARISNALTALASRFLTWTKRLRGIKDSVGSAFGKKTQTDLKNANTGLSNVGSGLGGTGKQAKGAKKAVQALKRELLGFDKITKLAGEQGTTSGSAGTTGGGVSSGGADVAPMAVDDYTEGVSKLGSAVDYLSKIKIPQPLQEAIDRLKESVGGLLDLLSTMGKWVLKNVLKPLGKWLAKELAPAVLDVLSSSIKAVTSVLEVLFEILKLLWKPLIKPLFKFLGSVAITSLKGLSTALELVAQFFGAVATAIKDLPEKFANLKAKWEEIRTAVAGKVLTFKTKFEEKVKEKWKSLNEWWKKRKTSVKTFKADFFNGVKEKWKKFKEWWKKLRGGEKKFTVKFGFVDKLRDAWNWLAGAIQDARKTRIGRALLPNVPYLAEGGYVKANTPQLAMIGDNKHEGEVVAPESKLRAMAQEVASANNNAEVVVLLRALLNAVNALDLDVQLDGESIKQNTVRRINQHTRATGQLELII